MATTMMAMVAAMLGGKELISAPKLTFPPAQPVPETRIYSDKFKTQEAPTDPTPSLRMTAQSALLTHFTLSHAGIMLPKPCDIMT
jgi:hypothetical protein